MSAFLDKQAHLFTEDANETRLVISTRWVVETVNGQLKNWRVLNNIIQNVQIPYFGGHNPNIEWYCQYKVGSGVVGCCAHVASVLWYSEYWSDNHTQTKTPRLGYADTFQDAAIGCSNDDSASESEKDI
ncbi:hypothetical protein TNCV_3220731 [Trichonephila clavipes]|nr:hypothetical protein TNCV_3220731 [Trichonephila clavipes]